MKKSLLIIFIILILDQSFKFWIKLHFTIGEEVHVFGNWFILHFTENNGMAFGIQLAGEWGKLTLSLFRILAVFAIGFYLWRISRRKASQGLIVSISLILAGALGNILDSAFYGMLFSNSSYHTVATWLPDGGGYAGFLHGKVVDMLYFPLIEFHRSEAPAWLPDFLFGSDNHFVFFRPVFNLADSSITIGVFYLILFQRKQLSLF